VLVLSLLCLSYTNLSERIGAYYAAQMGIGLKAKDTPSREVLLALLGALERLKNEIGPNDAVDVDAAGAAYLENFGLKVFASADNEDRAGRPNKWVVYLASTNCLLTVHLGRLRRSSWPQLISLRS
jgi:Vta1 like